eukprot:COSAG06_NODE_826_length_12064_cov_8.219975_13_plen_112_part_00
MAARARPGAVLARQCLQKPDAGLWRDALALRALAGSISAGVSCSARGLRCMTTAIWAESKQVPRSNLCPFLHSFFGGAPGRGAQLRSPALAPRATGLGRCTRGAAQWAWQS